VAACAAITYCLGLLKQGLVQDTALAWVGQLERLELGLPVALLADLPANQPLALLSSDRANAPWPQRPLAAGKDARGRLLEVSGSAAYPGAGQLSLLGASASGCGSLRAALPRALAEQIWLVQPHVVISAALEERAGGGLALADLALPGLLERLDAVLVGPGIGGDSAGDSGSDGEGGTWGDNGGNNGGGSEAGSEAGQRMEQGSPATAGGEEQGWEVLRRFPGLVVLDADGLNRLAAGVAGAPEEWLRGRAGATWLTPHQGEFARLFPDLAGESPLRAAAAAAQRCRVSLALKGARTVVAAADGRRWQVLHAAAAAARAGLGDVLAGYAAGRGACAGTGGGELLAAAVLDHAEAGLTCARQRGAGQTTPQAVAATLGSAWDRPLESGER
jgi:NAD(P)H-hydrate epimerase